MLDRVIEDADFDVMVKREGMRPMPEGKGTVHKMEPGKFILLDQYDTWIPDDSEPFMEQVRRVRLSPKEVARREERTEVLRQIYITSPLYANKADDAKYWKRLYASRVNW